LRAMAKRRRSGKSLASIRKAYGLPSHGRAVQEVNEAIEFLAAQEEEE
jgi:hypothetical protein